MFDLDLMEYIVKEINHYATTRENHRKTGKHCVRIHPFLGTLMGIRILPSLHNYWSTNYYLGVPNVVQKFPRDCFNETLRKLHFNDNGTTVP